MAEYHDRVYRGIPESAAPAFLTLAHSFTGGPGCPQRGLFLFHPSKVDRAVPSAVSSSSIRPRWTGLSPARSLPLPSIQGGPGCPQRGLFLFHPSKVDRAVPSAVSFLFPPPDAGRDTGVHLGQTPVWVDRAVPSTVSFPLAHLFIRWPSPQPMAIPSPVRTTLLPRDSF
jgi:hypothetical protein